MRKIVPQSIKNVYHFFQAILANFWYGWPSRKIKIIGVTGTNGKTTTVQMITRILEKAPSTNRSGQAAKVAMASTINFKLGEKEWVNETKYTTLSPFAVQKFISQAVDSGCEYLVLETSSHSLDQYRVWGVDYHTAVITNVTREHLDYHQTMEKYRAAKMKLFQKAKVVVVNLDMEKPADFLVLNNKKKYGYSAISNFQFPISNQFSIPEFQKITAEGIKLEIDKSNFKIQDTNFQIHLPGKFNIENALAATCVGLAEGISLEKIAQALEKIKGVPGRLENIPNDRGLNIIIDYAVTPDSLEKLYQFVLTFRKTSDVQEGHRMSSAKIISVFGSCGERDRGKRPMMGEIVARTADYVIVTNEDPYHEDPMRIINEVFMGVVGSKESIDLKQESSVNFQFPIFNFQSNLNDQNIKLKKVEGVNCWRIMDRREAIKKALQLAKPGDIVLVTGKGAEEMMAVGDKLIPWNDKSVIEELLREI